MKTELPKLRTVSSWWNGKPKLTKEGKALLSVVKGREKHALKAAILNR